MLLNQRFLEMYNLSPDVVRVGVSFADMLRSFGRARQHPPRKLEEHHSRRLDLMARGKPFRLLRQLATAGPSRRTIGRSADGGWLTLVEDVTERQRREADLRLRFERYRPARSITCRTVCA